MFCFLSFKIILSFRPPFLTFFGALKRSAPFCSLVIVLCIFYVLSVLVNRLGNLRSTPHVLVNPAVRAADQ